MKNRDSIGIYIYKSAVFVYTRQWKDKGGPCCVTSGLWAIVRGLRAEATWLRAVAGPKDQDHAKDPYICHSFFRFSETFSCFLDMLGIFLIC